MFQDKRVKESVRRNRRLFYESSVHSAEFRLSENNINTAWSLERENESCVQAVEYSENYWCCGVQWNHGLKRLNLNFTWKFNSV